MPTFTSDPDGSNTELESIQAAICDNGIQQGLVGAQFSEMCTEMGAAHPHCTSYSLLLTYCPISFARPWKGKIASLTGM